MAETPDASAYSPLGGSPTLASHAAQADIVRLIVQNAELSAQNDVLRKALWCIQAELAERETIFNEEDESIMEVPRTLADVAPNIEQIIRYAFRAIHSATEQTRSAKMRGFAACM